MSEHDSYEDVVLWESIRYRVERETGALVEAIEDEIPKDDLLGRYQNEKPVPHQLHRIIEHRANSWAQRAYGICCAAWAQPITREFDRAVWKFAVEPFIDNNFYDLLLRAIGIRFPSSRDMLSKLFGNLPRPEAPKATERLVSPSAPDIDERRLITVDQRRCCEEARSRVSRRWRAELMLGLSEDPEITEAVRVLSRARELEEQAMRVAKGLPPVPVPSPASSESVLESPQKGSEVFALDSKASPPPVVDMPAAAPSAPLAADQGTANERRAPLPPKEYDYSGLMDSAGLTELQRECYSLKHEYQLPVAKIARRLGRDRKTIQEHIEAADKKVTLAANKERGQKRRARFGLE